MRGLTVADGPHRAQVFTVTDKEDVPALIEKVNAPLEGQVNERGETFRSQWVHLPMKCGAALESLEAAGFTFHHAEGTTSVLTRWVGDGPNRIPEYATHRVGVAGLVTHGDKVLLVREKGRKFTSWKLPGGHADLGEDIPETAIREVREETGIDATFDHLLCFRHTHGLAQGRSDLYFVCKLTATSTDVKKCDVEIADADWLPIETLLESKSEMNRTLGELFRTGQLCPMKLRHQQHLLTGNQTCFYHAPPFPQAKS